MKRYKLKDNTLDVDDAAMKGKLAFHFYAALYPGKDFDKASADQKMIMRGLADIAYEQLEKHMVEPAPPKSNTVPLAANT